MPASVTSVTRRPSPRPAPTARRPFRDNPRLILSGIAVLVAVLVAILLVSRTPRFTPDFLTEFVLYALTAADLTMLAALVFILARNIVKLVVESRRGLPFARFRAKLVALLLGMTLVPTILVLVVGSELIRTNIDRWFSTPMAEILATANQIAGDYYRERQLQVSDEADRIARTLTGVELNDRNLARVRDLLASDDELRRVQVVEVYRIDAWDGDVPSLEWVAEIAPPVLPPGYNRSAAEQLAAQALRGTPETRSVEALGNKGDLLHAAAVIPGLDERPRGVVVTTDYLTGDLADRSRRMARAFESYNQLRVLSRPLTGVYLSFFLMVTLLILFGAIWMGSYLAKRITRPVHALEEAAREIGAGRLDQHIEPETADEFGALTDAFNTMASELGASRRKIEHSTIELERKHREVEERHRYIKTILERIATGVVSVDADGTITTINSAAGRLLSLDPAVIGQPVASVFARPDLQSFDVLIRRAAKPRTDPVAEEIAISREGQDLHLAAAATALVGESGGAEGAVLVLDDVTPLIRTQKVAAWREVARRLAHEIKNPLTPIQLSAERIRRHLSLAPSGTRDLVDECTKTIVGEVESLKGLVDEFAQFARMPSPRIALTDLHALVEDTLALYGGIFTEVEIERRLGPDVPLVRLDGEQIRRVIINLVDNALEAMGHRGRIVVETERDVVNNVVRIQISDNGPGIPPAEREKLFLPYYSTKRRGSGLGLAIVRRIIAEHGGSIAVSDNVPRGTRFTIELPI